MAHSEDADRVARRFVEVWGTFTPPGVPRDEWDEISFKYRHQLLETFTELLKAEVIFPGPSLYADSSV